MIEVYTDGSCYPNPGPGGWGFVAPILAIERHGASDGPTTNNRMEMQAIIEALREFAGPLTIYSDSQWCIGVLDGGWKAKKNPDLIAEARSLIGRRRVKFVWVRGHNGCPHNGRADELAGRWRAA